MANVTVLFRRLAPFPVRSIFPLASRVFLPVLCGLRPFLSRSFVFPSLIYPPNDGDEGQCCSHLPGWPLEARARASIKDERSRGSQRRGKTPKRHLSVSSGGEAAEEGEDRPRRPLHFNLLRYVPPKGHPHKAERRRRRGRKVCSFRVLS